MKKLMLLLGLCFTTLGFAQQNDQNGIHVTGEGTVNVVPDQVMIKVSVQEEGKTAEEVKTKTDDKVDAVLTFLKKEGVKSKYIQTDYVRMHKDHYNDRNPGQYRSMQSMSILLEDVEDYESVMNGLFAQGINQIEGIFFQSSKQEELKSEARSKAITDAKAKADQYAKAVGQEVGKAYRIVENGSQGPSPVMYRSKLEVASSPSADKNTIAVGEVEISVSVQVSFGMY